VYLCPAQPTLLAAQAACDADITCLGVSFYANWAEPYELRGSLGTTTLNSMDSWLIKDPAACGHRPPSAHAVPPGPEARYRTRPVVLEE
jgi:hypothetical protein